jgi:hypothetical protein
VVYYPPRDVHRLGLFRETLHSLPSLNRNPTTFAVSSAVTQQKTGNMCSFIVRKEASLLCAVTKSRVSQIVGEP